MASFAAAAPSMRVSRRQFGAGAGDALERWLEAERDQLALWVPVAMGAGVAAWYALPDAAAWTAAVLAMLGLGLMALAVGRGGRAARAAAIALLMAALGAMLIWARAERVAAPVLGAPAIASFAAMVERVEPLPARDLVRLTLAPRAGATGVDGEPVALPARVRVNLATADAPRGVTPGAVVALRARLMPPAPPTVPGAYDFAQAAWFARIGATGRGFAPVRVVAAGAPGSGLRASLSAHIESKIPGSAGGIASALATGDMGAITQDDSDAMRKAGLAHLLSVSGLHITAAVAATMLIVMRLLALSPTLALRVRLPMIAALAGAAAAIGYTLLTGAEVPTIRSCVAALLVLAAFALGRQAMTLRLVATGAVVVLLAWPEAVAGPSFQLSFAAVTAIMALHEHPRIHALFGPHEEARRRRMLREGGSLLLTGLVVELALMPIAVFHFHKEGVYGAIVNLVAIPLTTFVVMPLEALALLFDGVGLGAPWWWLTARSLDLLLWMARATAAAPGSVAALPAMPTGAYALTIVGGLWIALWRTRVRRLGVIPLAIGALWAVTTPAPDLLVTGDGRHVAMRTPEGGLALLRDRTGDYTATTLGENGGVLGLPELLSDRNDARCSRDACIVDRVAAGRHWRILATRSGYRLEAPELIAACATADIAISERWLPKACRPRWLKLDKPVLAKTGGVAITLGRGVMTVRDPADRHPWRDAPTLTVVRRDRWPARHGWRVSDPRAREGRSPQS